jgi:hypothetical protein
VFYLPSVFPHSGLHPARVPVPIAIPPVGVAERLLSTVDCTVQAPPKYATRSEALKSALFMMRLILVGWSQRGNREVESTVLEAWIRTPAITHLGRRSCGCRRFGCSNSVSSSDFGQMCVETGTSICQTGRSSSVVLDGT